MSAWARRGAPRPPRELEAQMEAAGRDGDTVRLGILRAQYAAWLTDQGWTEPAHRGTGAPDRAYLPDPEETSE